MSKGRIIGGRYRLEQRLGRGNFGVVWRADELLAGEPVAAVAVKIFTAEVDRREISLLAGVSHASILAYRAVVEDDGEVCLVTELADGGDAAARLRAWPDGLPASEVKVIVGSIGSALEHLHGQGWVHRDVKPANILFVKGTAKLGDVGTARALDSTARATSTASLAYAAPEVFSGKFGPAVDVYALGCTVYELLTGRLPFDGSMTELVHKHLNSEIEFPSDMPPSFVEMIRSCTHKEPERRWAVGRILTWANAEESAGAVAKNAFASPAPPEVAPAQAGPSAAFTEAWSARRGQPSAPRAAEGSARPAAPPPAGVSQQVPPARERPPEPPQAPPPSPPRAETSSPASSPTPLDPALRRHLRHHGERWGDSNAWRAFMETAGPTARQHGLSERDLIRRASQLLPEVQAARLSEQETIAQIGAWVSALHGPRWSAPAWADFLDQINAHDELGAARIRDALVARLYPPVAGATRMLDLGGGQQHLMIYLPLDKLYRPTTRVLDTLSSRPASGIAGVWFSARPITVQEWSAICAEPVPPNLKPDSTALAPFELAEATLVLLKRRFPVEELRWPKSFEYDGIRWQREQAAPKPVPSPSRQGALAQPRQRPGSRSRSPTLGSVLATTLGTAAVNFIKESNEAWMSGATYSAKDRAKKLAMNLVSPVPMRG